MLISGKNVIFVILLIFKVSTSFAQSKNNPSYDTDKVFHLGVTVGSGSNSFKYKTSNLFYNTDTVVRVSMRRYPDLHAGGVFNLHLGNYFDFRFIPTLVISQRGIEYTLNSSVIIDSVNIAKTDRKEIESNFIEFPLLFKFKSERMVNTRFYVIGGAKYAYDMTSEANAERDPNDPIVAVYPHNFYYEYGFGLDLYFPYFKFSPEIKFSKGINNVLVPDQSFHTNIFSSFYSNAIMLSVYFE
jgi:hypothetical protein